MQPSNMSFNVSEVISALSNGFPSSLPIMQSFSHPLKLLMCPNILVCWFDFLDHSVQFLQFLFLYSCFPGVFYQGKEQHGASMTIPQPVFLIVLDLHTASYFFFHAVTQAATTNVNHGKGKLFFIPLFYAFYQISLQRLDLIQI